MSDVAPFLHPCLGEKLPWTVEISGASVYTIHQSSQLHYLAEPASVSATVAVTTKYTPPMSDNITSLGLVLHADLDTMVVACSQRQVGMWIFMPPAPEALCFRVVRPSVRPSVRPKPEIPSFDLYMGPLVHPTNRNRFTACPSVRPSVRTSVRPSVRRGFLAFAGECMEG